MSIYAATGGTSRRRLLLEASRAAVEAMDLTQLADTSVALLIKALDASFGGAFRTNDGTDMIGAVPRSQAHMAGAIGAYMAVAGDDPIHRAKITHNPEVEVISEMVPSREITRSAVHAVIRRYDTEQMLVMRLSEVPHGQRGATGILLARSRHQAAFGSAEIDELRAIRPILCAAIARNERSQLLDAVAQTCAGAAIAFEADGRIAWISREAEALLGEQALPPVLGDAARRLCSIEQAEMPEDVTVPLVIQLPGALEAVFHRSRTTADGRSIAIAQLAPARVAAWSDALPPRLRRVFELLKTGASEKEIAHHAGLSYASAHQYVVQIYRRASVASRAQLMAMIASPSS